MHHFYVSHPISGDSATIDDIKQVHHIRVVLRLQPGDDVVLFDKEAKEYGARLMTLTKKQAIFSNLRFKKAAHSRYKITFACAIPKKSLMDDIIDKLAQLGADVIVPLITERVIVKPEGNRESQLERWRLISCRAAEQSRRNIITSIPDIMDLTAVLKLSENAGLKLIPTLEGSRKTLKEAVTDYSGQEIFVLIGPEGDFTPLEIEQASKAGFIPISLGDTVLRTETAAIAVASYLRFTLME